MFVRVTDYGSDEFYVLTWRRLCDLVARHHSEYLDKHEGVRPKRWDSFHSAISVQHLSKYRTTTEEIRDYLFSLPHGPITIKNKRTYLLAAFAWWQKQGWTSGNAVKPVETPLIHDKEPEILTVPETRQLFRVNEKVDPETRPRPWLNSRHQQTRSNAA